MGDIFLFLSTSAHREPHPGQCGCCAAETGSCRPRKRPGSLVRWQQSPVPPLLMLWATWGLRSACGPGVSPPCGRQGVTQGLLPRLPLTFWVRLPRSLSTGYSRVYLGGAGLRLLQSGAVKTCRQGARPCAVETSLPGLLPLGLGSL